MDDNHDIVMTPAQPAIPRTTATIARMNDSNEPIEPNDLSSFPSIFVYPLMDDEGGTGDGAGDGTGDGAGDGAGGDGAGDGAAGGVDKIPQDYYQYMADCIIKNNRNNHSNVIISHFPIRKIHGVNVIVNLIGSIRRGVYRNQFDGDTYDGSIRDVKLAISMDGGSELPLFKNLLVSEIIKGRCRSWNTDIIIKALKQMTLVMQNLRIGLDGRFVYSKNEIRQDVYDLFCKSATHIETIFDECSVCYETTGMIAPCCKKSLCPKCMSNLTRCPCCRRSLYVEDDDNEDYDD